MLTENMLLDLGKKFQKKNNRVLVMEVKDGAQDAIVRISKKKILVVSENDNGSIRFAFGKSATFVEHGIWILESSQGVKREFKLLEH